MPSNAHDLGPVASFRDGVPQRFEIDGRAVVVVRKGGEFLAIRDTCPHAGASLSRGCVVGIPTPALPGETPGYEREGEVVSCPWHGWAFDLRNGRCLARPEKVRVRAYAVAVRDGRVLLEA
jgi:3-phenylpropionate/trans-cinnamate dioxygenase ferredoxin subunit